MLPLLINLEGRLQGLFMTVLWWIIQYGFLGFYAAMIIQAIIAVIPSELILMFGGIAYSYIYWPLNMLYGYDYAMLATATIGGIGEISGATAGFFIARTIGRPLIARWEQRVAQTPHEENPNTGKVSTGKVSRIERVLLVTIGDAILIADNWLEKWGAIAVLVTRLTPPIPFDAVSYGAGLTKIGFKPFIAATAVGAFPRALMYAYLGKTIYQNLVLIPQILRTLIYTAQDTATQYTLYTLLANNPLTSNPYTIFFTIAAAIIATLYATYQLIKRKYLHKYNANPHNTPQKNHPNNPHNKQEK